MSQSHPITLDLLLEGVLQRFYMLTGQTLPTNAVCAGELPTKIKYLKDVVEGHTASDRDKILQTYEEIIWFFVPPYAALTHDFWRDPVGQILLKARVLAEEDELISITEAAGRMGCTTLVLSNWINRGLLNAYIDPTIRNNHRNRRLLWSEVKTFALAKGYQVP